MRRIKEVNIKNWTYYFYNDMININTFDPGLLKVDKTSCKNIDIYYTVNIDIYDTVYMQQEILVILKIFIS